MRVDEHTIEVAGLPVFYRSAPAAGTPPLYIHGPPTSSDDWTELLARTGGVAPDLPGFGRSGKGGHLDYSISGFAEFLAQLLDALSIERFQLVGHSWGAAAGLALAARDPARVERIALCNPLALVSAFEWTRLARIYRTRGLGELAMGFTTKWLLARWVRRGSAGPQSRSEERINAIWGQFDQGTQRALLRLHRSVSHPPGESRRELQGPALIIWGERDPWLSPAIADELGHRLPQVRIDRVPDAGHWPWLDRPEVADTLASFLGAS